ncbi:hypothetical protein PV783_29375 [Chitinophaga sp. CC14]|uniref:hypothetical protein n=1 Tax=Chitinophaga sp. CC14 TaxID=3029199 RepID=UPI003B7E53D3
METKPIQKYQEFLSKSILIDQTHLIAVLLDKKVHDQSCYVYNQLEYTGFLSAGSFWGTEDMIWIKKEEILKEIDKLKISREQDTILDHKQLAKDLEQLTSDLRKVNEMKGRKRSIYQWLLVPHWLSSELITMGEVVFRAFGCSWWGVSSILDDYFTKEQVLLDLVEEIDIADIL